MPELPEVQTVVDELKKHVLNKTIYNVGIFWPKTVQQGNTQDFIDQLKDAIIVNVTRRGKYIVMELQKQCSTENCKLVTVYLLTHLRMTGQFLFNPKIEPKHARIRFDFADKSFLVFNDSRKFGKVQLVENLTEATKHLGHEPLEVDEKTFSSRIKEYKRAIKPLLLDQSFLSGIGNIYADEALHRAGIHPQTLSQNLSKKQITVLYKAIQYVLKKGIQLNGASFDTFYKRINGQSGSMQDEFTIYGRGKKNCLKCATPIKKIIVAQRGTHFCPNCQKL